MERDQASRLAELTAIGRCVEAALGAGGIIRAVGMGTLVVVSVEMPGEERKTCQGEGSAPWLVVESWIGQKVAKR